MANIHNILANAQKIQDEYAKKLAAFEKKEFEYNYKSDSVVVKIKGNGLITAITVNKILIDPEDKITMEEMIMEAVNYAINDINDERNKLMPKMGVNGF